MDFQNEYDSATDAIDDVLTSQVGPKPSWSNVVGELVKASASSAGYVWGYNNVNQLFMCTVPCSGNWSLVSIPGTILDVTTDNMNWLVVVISGFIMLITLNWLITGKYHFKGPKRFINNNNNSAKLNYVDINNTDDTAKNEL
jgi:hypothetical protein